LHNITCAHFVQYVYFGQNHRQKRKKIGIQENLNTDFFLDIIRQKGADF